MILGIDPGTTESAFVRWDGKRIDHFGKRPNEDLTMLLEDPERETVAIEMIASYGMPVGKEVFETCLWIGRFMAAAQWGRKKVRLVYRRDIKIYLCGNMKAKDANIRQALIDKVGPQGTKKNRGPTYGISKDIWSALAVAVFAEECKEKEEK